MFHLLGCAHAQQLIWQLFNTVEKGYQAAQDNDAAFLAGELVDVLTQIASDLIIRGTGETRTDGQRYPGRVMGAITRWASSRHSFRILYL